MRIIVKRQSWSQAAGFSEALVPYLKPSVKIAVVGSGGKTSIILRLAEELRALGKKALVLTTTHMFRPEEHGVFSGFADDVEETLRTEGIAIAGKETAEGKITWPGELLYNEIAPMADVVLIEADGSKRLPVKFPNENEPVIPENVDVILVVSGLSAVGRGGKDVCHRWELARQALGIADEDESLTPEHLRGLMEKGYLIPLRDSFPQIPIIPVFNQADGAELEQTGKRLAGELGSEACIVSSFITHTLGVVYMASGFGKRFGSNKLLYTLAGKPLFQHALSSLIKASEELRDDCAVSIAVISRYPEILAEAESSGLTAVENFESEKGITASIKLGLKSLPPSEHYAFFVADQPYLKPETTAAFIRAYLESGKTIGTVTDGKNMGNPCIYSRDYLPELLALEGDRGGKQVLVRHPQEVFYFTADASELLDLDTHEDLR